MGYVHNAAVFVGLVLIIADRGTGVVGGGRRTAAVLQLGALYYHIVPGSGRLMKLARARAQGKQAGM